MKRKVDDGPSVREGVADVDAREREKRHSDGQLPVLDRKLQRWWLTMLLKEVTRYNEFIMMPSASASDGGHK